MQYLPVYRAPRRVPLCYGFGASYEGKLGQTDEAHSRQRLSASRKNYNGVWQSEYARQKFILRSVSTGWGTETCQTFWVPSYTQAWQQTWHRRDRAGRADAAVPWQERIDKLEDLNVELKNWQQDRNESQKGVDRQFTAENARGKQKHLYPILSF